ncbi:ATP-binding protein [Pollutimonas thiosulfatoxidans]|uniref:Biotin carboxylase n=1 Tax=Pollutimonas thiosulfatoxidans TaxID=2028345 RepID=A0A410GEB8_9BURK|nr:biotin carboxylase N-terminal domain-containing protein [Pollutimonas thiosulfatoxidans]QAA94609.1 biotin carboxylase [Pollutimonas thiosulfatoxidans]
MFESVLIANRGEIACRVIRTCRRLGIRSIAVYSTADASARHVREADEAVCIGDPEVGKSYLNADAIIKAAMQTGAQAIHPGYGFLSESTSLVDACKAHGITWVGPRADVIRSMGSKIESKRIATAAGVPCVPGYHGDNQDPDFLYEQAKAIGVPLLIKASAGGGGKGMRRVDKLDDFLAQLELAKHEAERAFGDATVLIEKLVLRPRHLEVQLAGDHHGNLVHVFERECSIQRNYQKVIEEAPAPRLSAAVRQKLFDAALSLGKEIRYDSLGTVEFVLGEESEEPYFLEMNTRLQVEHPVTETITGLDLVEWQLRIAFGETLPLAQEQIQYSGWAIEARINCEDPGNGYRPLLGEVSRYAESSTAGVRVDSGIGKGSMVTPYYDSMVAKIIGHGATRSQATERLIQGLRSFDAEGIGTNQAFLISVVEHSLFSAGRLTTGYLAEAFPQGWHADPGAVLGAQIVAAFAALKLPVACSDQARDYWQQRQGYRFMSAAGRRAITGARLIADGAEIVLAFERLENGWKAQVDGEEKRFRIELLSEGFFRYTPIHGTPRDYRVSLEGDTTVVSSVGMQWRMQALSELQALARADAAAGADEREVKAEMPGSVTAVNVAPGDEVLAGDVLVVMEAMKLIFSLVAPRDGKVEATLCTIGEVVASGQVLVQLEETETQALACDLN